MWPPAISTPCKSWSPTRSVKSHPPVGISLYDGGSSRSLGSSLHTSPATSQSCHGRAKLPGSVSRTPVNRYVPSSMEPACVRVISASTLPPVLLFSPLARYRPVRSRMFGNGSGVRRGAALLRREPLPRVEPDALAVEHRVLDDR